VGRALTESSHDVRALDSEIELEGLSDPEVLELAAEGRVLVTANIRDFEPLLREWASERRSHAGVILVPARVKNEAFGALISGDRRHSRTSPRRDGSIASSGYGGLEPHNRFRGARCGRHASSGKPL
jgi:hypothetical protein